MMTRISARRDDPAAGASLVDAIVGVAVVTAALLVAGALLAPALRALDAGETELRATERPLLEALE